MISLDIDMNAALVRFNGDLDRIMNYLKTTNDALISTLAFGQRMDYQACTAVLNHDEWKKMNNYKIRNRILMHGILHGYN